MRTDRCFVLEVRDRVMALADGVDATERMHTINRGAVCTFTGCDNDDDL